ARDRTVPAGTREQSRLARWLSVERRLLKRSRRLLAGASRRDGSRLPKAACHGHGSTFTMTTFPTGPFRLLTIPHINPAGFGSVGEVEVIESSGMPRVGTRLARKQLGPQWAQHPEMRERFEREIDLLDRMRHPNIVGLVGVSMSATERFYVMPLYPQSLRD